MRIGIDLMGSDRSPAVLFKAIEQAVEVFPWVDWVVFITKDSLNDILEHSTVSLHLRNIRLQFHTVSDVIEMQDEPLLAIRQKGDSSLVWGFKLLKKCYLDGFISAGNTGALIAAAALYLPFLRGIRRPALLAILPTETGNVAIIDVGGNVFCKACHLLQFARLGVAYQRCCNGVERPRVGLLNIGVESKKGTSELRQAYGLLQELAQCEKMHFLGNVEGRQVFQGVVDVLVTDGFTGNVLLKTSEGVSSFILQRFQHLLQAIPSGQRQAILNDLHDQFDDEAYPGAIICGVDGVAVKCHGQSSAKGLFRGIQGTVQLIQNGFVSQIKQEFM